MPSEVDMEWRERVQAQAKEYKAECDAEVEKAQKKNKGMSWKAVAICGILSFCVGAYGAHTSPEKKADSKEKTELTATQAATGKINAAPPVNEEVKQEEATPTTAAPAAKATTPDTVKQNVQYVRGVEMPAGCQADKYPELNQYVNDHQDPSDPKFVKNEDISGYVCGFN